MILLDTHIWVKWVLDEKQLPKPVRKQVAGHEEDGLGECDILLGNRQIDRTQEAQF